VDYLLDCDAAKVQKALYMKGNKTVECKIAMEIGGSSEPVIGFGCSDCTFKSDFFRVDDFDFLLQQMYPLRI